MPIFSYVKKLSCGVSVWQGLWLSVRLFFCQTATKIQLSLLFFSSHLLHSQRQHKFFECTWWKHRSLCDSHPANSIVSATWCVKPPGASVLFRNLPCRQDCSAWCHHCCRVGFLMSVLWRLRHLNVFGFHGKSDDTRASPELCRSEGPEWTAFGQSGVRTRPFSPTLPVMDRRALFRMASVKVSCVRREKKDRNRENGSQQHVLKKPEHHYLNECTLSASTYKTPDYGTVQRWSVLNASGIVLWSQRLLEIHN